MDDVHFVCCVSLHFGPSQKGWLGSREETTTSALSLLWQGVFQAGEKMCNEGTSFEENPENMIWSSKEGSKHPGSPWSLTKRRLLLPRGDSLGFAAEKLQGWTWAWNRDCVPPGCSIHMTLPPPQGGSYFSSLSASRIGSQPSHVLGWGICLF